MGEQRVYHGWCGCDCLRHTCRWLRETHGRKETEELLEGLEVLPRRVVDFQFALGALDTG